MTNKMTELSPAAQAVMNACTDAPIHINWATRFLAAALRAVAERNEYKPNMSDEMEVMFSEGWNSHRKELLAIADELEAL
jgi:hypothetical protein